MTSAVRVSCGLYKMLLLIYPRDFRLRFESEMVTILDIGPSLR